MILLMGVAGSGKSTQGKLLADKKGYAWLSSGNILRVLVTGSRRQEMLQGKLLDDDEMIKVFNTVFDLINPADEFVLDGFPRTVKQAEWLLGETNKHRLSRLVVLHLYADEKDVRRRLADRGRVDDNDVAIAKRFKEYEEVTVPIIKMFKEKGIKVHEIDASRDRQTIHDEITRIIS